MRMSGSGIEGGLFGGMHYMTRAHLKMIAQVFTGFTEPEAIGAQHVILQSAQDVERAGLSLLSLNALKRLYPILAITGQVVYQCRLYLARHNPVPVQFSAT
jgi:hypothetical protein